MSARGILASFRCAGVIGLAIALDVLAAPVTTSPADQSSVIGKSEQPVGAIQAAMKRLYSIPRPEPGTPSEGPAGTSRLGLQHYDAMRKSVSSVPTGGQVLPHNLGNQHADAMRDSLSSSAFNGSAVESDRSKTDRGQRIMNAAPGDDFSFTGSVVYPAGVYYPRHRVPHNEREWNNYVYYNGRPSRYGFGMHDEYGDSLGGDFYRQGFNRGYNVGRFDHINTERQERLLSRARGHLEKGLRYFRNGEYRQAVSAFRLAADTNQGDPISRLYAAHALFATGRYREAIPYLQRAFELQPKIAFLQFNIRDDYGRPTDFDQQLHELEVAHRRFPRNIDRLTVLGYIYSYTDQPAKAFEVLSKANRIAPKDALIQKLLDNCHPPDVVLDEMEARRAGDRDKDSLTESGKDTGDSTAKQ